MKRHKQIEAQLWNGIRDALYNASYKGGVSHGAQRHIRDLIEQYAYKLVNVKNKLYNYIEYRHEIS